MLATRKEPTSVDQRGRLQGLARLLVGQPGRRELAQLVVDQRQQLLGRRRITLRDGGQDVGNITHRRHPSSWPQVMSIPSSRPKIPEFFGTPLVITRSA